MNRGWMPLVLVAFVGLALAAVGQEITVQRGGTVNVGASLGAAWTLEFDGEFDAVKLGRWTAKRYVYDGGNNSSLDLFENGCIRLSRGSVYFLSATDGRIRNPNGEKDHYAIVDNYEGRHCLRIAYDPQAKRCQVTLDGKRAGDFALRIARTGTIGRLSCPGFAGTVRLLKGGSLTGGGGGTGRPSDGGASLDDVLGGGRTGPGGPAGTMDASDPGTKTFTAPQPGTLRVTAKLATYGPATLEVGIAGGDKPRTWLSWSRAGAVDPSPLSVDGKPAADSIFERSPGDFSPRETTVETRLKAGETVTFRLEGDFGDGTPLLRYAFQED